MGAIAKVKQGGKFYSGTITAVGIKAEIELRWKELESADEAEESHSQTTQDHCTYYVHYCTCVCILRLCMHTYRILWLIKACAYSGKRNDSMRLIKDMRLYGT